MPKRLSVCNGCAYGNDPMYQWLTPHTALQPYIECYWRFYSAQPTTLQEQIFVDGQADWLFNFGTPYQRSDPTQPDETLLHSANLDAQRDYPILLAQQGLIRLVGVRFRVGGLAAFLPIPMIQLSNLILSPSEVLGNAADILEAQLAEHPDPAHQADLLDAFFLARLTPPSNALILAQATQRIRQQPQMSIQALADDLGYSIRNLDRLFRQQVGLSPKFYARIVRFQQTLSLLRQQPHLSLAQLAPRVGFYDQAHLTKETQQLAGQTPDQLRRQA